VRGADARVAVMQVSFTKLSAEQHRFAPCRGDGSREAVVLESRSDLIHGMGLGWPAAPLGERATG